MLIFQLFELKLFIDGLGILCIFCAVIMKYLPLFTF